METEKRYITSFVCLKDGKCVDEHHFALTEDEYKSMLKAHYLEKFLRDHSDKIKFE